MSAVALARVLRDEIEDAVSNLKEGVCSGNLKDFEEYRFVAGRILGLETAQAILDDIVQRFDKD